MQFGSHYFVSYEVADLKFNKHKTSCESSNLSENGTKMLTCHALLGLCLMCAKFSEASWYSNFLGTKTEIEPPRTSSPDKVVPSVSTAISNAPAEVLSQPIAISKTITNVAKYSVTKRHSNSSTTPEKHSFDNYLNKRIHENVVRLGELTELLFIGDTAFYRISKNRTRWSALERDYAAINLGSPGDRTEHLLHRFKEASILSGINASSPLVIAMIGASNANVGDSPSAIVSGVSATITTIKDNLKSPKIVLLSLLPRLGKAVSGIIVATNSLLEAKYGSKKESDIEYLDIYGNFLTNKTINLSLFMADKVNMNLAGQVFLYNEN